MEGRRSFGEVLSLRVLCLDIEGGYGGSSRSLYENLRQLPADVTTEVWCRRPGPAQQRYAAVGIPCQVMPDMPHISSLPRLSRNLYSYVKFFLRWSASAKFRDALVKAAERFDVIHFNHEGLFFLASWLRRRLGRSRPGFTMHIRTHLPSSFFSRWQFRTLARSVDALVFITENEKTRAEFLAGGKLFGETIYNAVAPPSMAAPTPGVVATDARFKIAALGNYAYVRGFDRLVDVAVELKRRGRSDILFVVAGEMKLPRSSPGKLGDLGRHGGELSDYAAAQGVAAMFHFLGHTADPESMLANCDLVVRPSRHNDPWGRDVLEAMASGCPVMAVGSYSRFVKSGVTGILHSAFNASQWADEILDLARDRDKLARLGRTAQQRVLQLCDGPARANDLVRLWKSARRGAKRVLFVLPDFEAGGAQRVLISIANALDRTRYSPSILALDERGPWRSLVAKDVPVVGLGRPRLRYGLAALRRILRQVAPDAIISTIGYLNLGVLLSRPPHTPVIVRESNMPGRGPRNFAGRAALRLAYAVLYRRADCVISPSILIADELTHDYFVPRNLIEVIHNPVDEGALRAAASPPRRRPGKGRQYVAVGRLARQKGYDRLLEALASFSEDFRLAIFGEGEERASLEAQSRSLGLADRVSFVGFDPNPAAWVAGADALLVPSRWEGMPNVVLEALACGTPVIATPESGAIHEIAATVKHGAVTIAPMGPDFLTAMAAAAAPPNRTAQLRISLLPDEFRMAPVVAAFEHQVNRVCN